MTTPRGLAIVNVADPMHPRVGRVGAPLNEPRRVAVQFRYAFVTDADGLKVIDVTFPDRPRVVDGAVVPLAEAQASIWREPTPTWRRERPDSPSSTSSGRNSRGSIRCSTRTAHSTTRAT